MAPPPVPHILDPPLLRLISHSDFHPLPLPGCVCHTLIDYNEMPTAVDNLTYKLTFAKQFLNCFADNVILCHLIGLDLDTYNRHISHRQLPNKITPRTNSTYTNLDRPTTTDYSEDQAIINDICVTLNQTITLINTCKDDGLQSPFLQNTIYCLVRKKRVHTYIRFRDGLHPT